MLRLERMLFFSAVLVCKVLELSFVLWIGLLFLLLLLVVVVVVVVDINSLSISIEKRSKKEIEMRK